MKLLFLLSFSILFKDFPCEGASPSGFSNDSVNCGGTFSGFQYPVISPNYPESYPRDRDCLYILKGSQSANCAREFHLQFLDFQLEASNGCDKDYVEIGSGSIYCGNSIGIRKYKGAEDGTLNLTFHSDGNATDRGFKILVTPLPCADLHLGRKQSGSFTPPTGTEEIVGSPSPAVYRPEVKSVAENDRPPSRLVIKNTLTPVISPAENYRLPEFEQHDFHDENCARSHSVNDDGIGSITSYLYLPPSQVKRPPKISGADDTTASNSPGNISSDITPSEAVLIGSFEDELRIAKPPADSNAPYDRIFAAPLAVGKIHETRYTFRPLKRPELSSQFYESTNGWNTYGTPDIPNANFDPFASDNSNDNNDNNDNEGAGYNPVSPNCGGNNNNPNYYPNSDNKNGNWKPGFNPGENFSPGSNVGGNYPDRNFGNGNRRPGSIGGGNFYLNKNPGHFGNYHPNDNFYSPAVDTSYYNVGGLPACCGTSYSSDSFILTNPGFPALIYSAKNYECQYTIQRTSDSVCQLQMYLKFFNFGSDDQFCAYGYVEIDGARLCGCKTGANVTSSFDNIATKIVNVKYTGYPRNKFAGFVIEVTQVGCSAGYLRLRNEMRRGQQPGGFLRNYQRNRRSTSDVSEADITSASEGTPPSSSHSYSHPKGKRDVGYFYEKPNSAALTTSQNLLLSSCRIFKFLNWVKAAKEVYLRNAQCSSTTGTNAVSSTISLIPIFPDAENSPLINYPSSSNCETVNVIEGTISSPYYPSSYSNNLNQCYRFYKAPGYCQLELAVLDFDLENSTICRKDYVSFSGQKRRYCGTSLAGSRAIFDMTSSSFADLYFVTDSSGTGRGFRAGFTQISC